MNNQKIELRGFDWVCSWYQSQCDGDWEHENQIKLITVSNPGWSLTIDLHGTSLEGVELEYCLLEVSDADWIGYKVQGNVFKASGDLTKLPRIFELFREICESEVAKIDLNQD
ncbi:MAG: immunity 53 family protein [Fibrobacterota bacterium]|nr:immunity 53 family protein [Fibrobacterota bacterium]QQS05676.1 MAG: immunity 53 family protein [Fibrobacterota bacterium]